VNVTRVLHVSVNVEGALAPTRAFYEDVLGLGSEPRPEIPGIAGHWFGLGGAQLHLVDAPPGPAGIRPAGNHYCVAVDDLDGAIAELDARGIEYRRGAQGDVVQIWFADPVGNTIELQQDR
jgi:catechol 2,3-dioxygenase-like lactoylglutathione lyase family enzyme